MNAEAVWANAQERLFLELAKLDYQMAGLQAKRDRVAKQLEALDITAEMALGLDAQQEPKRDDVAESASA